MKTIPFKKVLIAMDYDETSQKVAETGYSLAKSMNAETILLHVLAEQLVYYSSYMFMRALRVDVKDDLHKSTEAFMEKTKKHLGDENIQTIVKEGEVAETILDTAKELKVDLIVIGSHSRKWLDSILLGSGAEDVLKHTTIPLLVVPTKSRN